MHHVPSVTDPVNGQLSLQKLTVEVQPTPAPAGPWGAYRGQQPPQPIPNGQIPAQGQYTQADVNAWVADRDTRSVVLRDLLTNALGNNGDLLDDLTASIGQGVVGLHDYRAYQGDFATLFRDVLVEASRRRLRDLRDLKYLPEVDIDKLKGKHCILLSHDAIRSGI